MKKWAGVSRRGLGSLPRSRAFGIFRLEEGIGQGNIENVTRIDILSQFRIQKIDHGKSPRLPRLEGLILKAEALQLQEIGVHRVRQYIVVGTACDRVIGRVRHGEIG